MKETMHDCYLSQFGCMKRLLENRGDILGKFTGIYSKYMPDRIYLLGSGTSYNAAALAAPFMEKTLGAEVTPVVASAPINFFGKNPMVIAVSQSGRSTNTIDAIKKIKEKGIYVATLTDPADTPVSEAGDLPVALAADNELIGPRTRGYTATILTLYLMALESAKKMEIIGKDYEAAINGYKAVFDDGAAYYAACQNFYDRHFNNLSKAKKFVFVGKGVTARAADESALKVLETVCHPSMGYEYEEFLHGPVCFADGELALFLSLSNDHDRARMLKTAEIIGGITDNCYIITNDAGVTGEKILTLPSEFPEYAEAFTHILFGQLISAKLTEDLKRERHPRVKDIFSSMGTKTPAKE